MAKCRQAPQTDMFLRMSMLTEKAFYAVTMLVIVLGALRVIWDGLSNAWRGRIPPAEQTDRMRLELSGSLSLGLTFFMGAEIIKTFRVPTWMQLLKIVILIAIRQLLTWSLDADSDRLHMRLRNP